MARKLKLFGNILIGGAMRCDHGLHMGGSKDNLNVGGLDSPVIRDPISNYPYVPGSSLKGKMRALSEKSWGKDFNREGARGQNIWRHECDTRNDAQGCEVCRLFGTTGRGAGGSNFPARLKVRDMHLIKDTKDQLVQLETGLQYTEWKLENSLDRVTKSSMPRQIERVPAGSIFDLELVYAVQGEADPHYPLEDLQNLIMALSLVQDSALGGHGTRGYGKVSFFLTAIEARSTSWYVNRAGKAKHFHQDYTQPDQLLGKPLSQPTDWPQEFRTLLKAMDWLKE